MLLAFVSFLLGFWSKVAMGQNITLQPPEVEREGVVRTSVLFGSSDVVTLRWEEATQGLTFRVGLEPGEYGFTSFTMRGTTRSQFAPEVVGLPPGVYYGILTNSAERTFTEIQIDASTDPDIRYSREIRFAVETEQTPRILAPQNTISEQVPTFRWESVPGVTAYALVVSSTPFTVTSRSAQLSEVNGLAPTWVHFTTETSARYGEPSESNPLAQFAASSLVPGRIYYYAVFNAYSASDPAFLSVQAGGVSSFTLENRGALDTPFLTSPSEGQTVSAGQSVILEWDAVPGALSYDVVLFERLETADAISDLQVFASNTSNTSITLFAREVLRRGNYRWFVIANDREGAASVSETGSFRFDTPMGRFSAVTLSGSDGEQLIGAPIMVRSTDGGFSPINPFVEAFSSIVADSLSIGNYAFTASKDGFSDVTVSVEIRENELTQVALPLQPLPSRIIGQVVDGDGAPVVSADVQFEDIVSSEMFEATTDANGVFSRDLVAGTYEIQVTKAGFRPASPITVTVAENQTLVLPIAIIIIDDEVSVSGRVINQDGIAVPQARVLAVSGSLSLETVTDGSGQWNLELSEGSWEISTSKEGFLSSLPRSFSFRAGDVFSNINFVLVQQASRIEGTVQGHRTDADGSLDVFPLGDATVTAWPLAGEAVSTTTDSQGRFLLDLGTGAYRVSASAPGYDPNGTFDFVLDANETIRDVRFRLEEWTSTVFGSVIDGTGNRVDDALITTSGGGETTSVGGAFALPVPVGRQELRALHPDYVESDAVTVAPSANEQITGVQLMLFENAARLSGVAQTARGPVSGLTVVASQGPDVFETKTGPDGSYAFQLPSGLWEIAIVSDRYRLADPVVLPLRSGARAGGVTLSLVPDYVLMTGFISSGSRPLEGVRLAFEDLNESTGRPLTLTTQTAADGSYALIIGALTTYRLRIDSPGYETFFHTFTSPVADEEIGFDAALKPSISVLSGRVIRQGGGPVAGSVIEARIGSNTLFSSESAFDGSFSMSVEAGAYQLHTEAIGFESTSIPVQVAAGQQLEGLTISLQPSTGNLTVSVINPLGGVPVAGANLLMEGPTVRSASTDESGNASLSSLPPGSYQITVQAPGFQRITRTIPITARTTASERFILIPAQGVVSGSIRDAATGGGLTGATVRLTGVGVDRKVTTDDAGSYVFSAVPIGTYAIEAQRSGYGPAPSVAAQVTAATPGFTAADIRLTRADGRIEGTVTGASGIGLLSGVDVVARSTSGSISSRSRSDGTYSLTGLASGSWTVSAAIEGFRGSPVAVEVISGQTSSGNLVLNPNAGSLRGRIRAAGGSALPFDVSMEILTLQESDQTFSSAEGDFSFDGLPIGEPFILRSRMQREGYQDVERTVTIPATGQLDVGTISVQLKDATLIGNTGTGGATITLQDLVSGRSVAVVTASSTGSYELSNMTPGAYLVVPSHPGFQFTPANRTVVLQNGVDVEASFSATASVGIVQIAVRRSTGEGVPGIQVRVASLDRSIDELFTSDVNGLVLPSALPLGLRYRVEPVSIGFQFDPEATQIDLAASNQASISFVVREVNAFLSGTVRSTGGAPIADAQVVAFQSATVRYSTVSASDGSYQLGPMAGGNYAVSASRLGFVDASRNVTLASNQQLENVDLALAPQSVTIAGRVLRAGAPVPGLTVRLARPIAAEVVTDANGLYIFENVPVETGQTTVAEVAVDRSGRSALVRTLSYGATDVGSTLIVPDFVLSSGRIRITASDGVNPVPDLRLDVQGPEGRVLSIVTAEDGTATTEADLDTGEYLVTPVNSKRLLPPEAIRRVSIPNPDADVSATLVLPYQHVAPEFVRSDEPLRLVVTFPDGQFDTTLGFFVEFTLNGDDPVNQPLSLVNGELVATLPAPGELEITYRIVAHSTGGGLAYQTSVFRYTPIVAGRLQNLVLQPDPHNTQLRTGSSYTVQLQIRDGLGEDLTAAVLQSGSVTWSSQTGGVAIQPFTAVNGIGAVLTPQQAGILSVTVNVRLGTTNLQTTAIFAAGSATVSDLLVTAPETRLSNNGGSMALRVEGESDSGERVLLGDAVRWRLIPDGIAEIDTEGRLRTTDERFIGPLTVIAQDSESGLQDSLQISLFAQLEGDRDRLLTDHSGTEILMPAGAIPFRAQLGLSYPGQPEPKRFGSARDGEPGTTAGEHVVRFLLQSDRSLRGDTLAAPARISMTGDASLNLFQGNQAIGFYLDDEAAWSALPSETSGEQVESGHVSRLGDYAVVAEATSLQIRHLAALPTPFSPDIAPLKIGYFLESPNPPATVRVDILTVRGELVRRLVPEQQQWPGRYGSRTSPLEITWDGLTDDGRRARNGRYLIRVTARDRSGSVAQTIPVVLVK